MTIFYNIIAFLGGLAMFLYGMRVMGDGLKNSSGGAMREALARVTNKPYMGFILGMLVACIIQSSTATIVIAVGLVGAGFLTFHQSIGIVLGANVGTAITAQIIRLMDVSSGMDSPLYFFKADNLAPLALVIGITMIMFIKTSASKTAGSVACGFGILFMGLIYMSNVVSGFGESLSNLLTAFENNYFLGFLSGILVTGVVQSSSAVVGIIQSIASSVGVTFSAVFAVIIGVNIGDCVTTYLVSSIGAKPNQKRTAVVHIVYNVFAALLCFLIIFVGRTSGIIDDDWWNKVLNSGGVANIHGFFRLVPAVALLPLTGLFERITCSLVKEERIDDEDKNAIAALDALDERLFNTPALALEQVDRVVWEMSEIACHNFDAAVKQIYDYDPKRNQRIEARENLLDSMTDAANKYIVSLSPHVRLYRDTKRQNYTLKSLICYERIGDLAKNIANEVEELKSSGKEFSPTAMQELRIAFDAIYEILDITARAYRTKSSSLAAKVEPLEEVIDDLVEELNARHVYRMVNNLCDAFKGIQFQTILTNIEHISDKCSDIAVYILERDNNEIFGQEHSYIHELHINNDDEYKNNYNKKHDKYFKAIEAISMVSAPIDDDKDEDKDNGKSGKADMKDIKKVKTDSKVPSKSKEKSEKKTKEKSGNDNLVILI
ncbi:MAG: Na/Pi cotransporter family protein [Mogibacterium sp.]|nr:Na/Pi cotransporter family protein [Mogibacterium sp.]